MADTTTNSLLIPTLLAVFGFFGKSAYDIYIDKRKRNRELLESKLQKFYWPIFIRLEKNEDIYIDLYQGKKEAEDTLAHKIANTIEKEILMPNHKEILEVITKYRYLANPDKSIDGYLKAYIRHVSVYYGLIDAKVDKFPEAVSNAPYPPGIYEYFKEKTLNLQADLDNKNF